MLTRKLKSSAFLTLGQRIKISRAKKCNQNSSNLEDTSEIAKGSTTAPVEFRVVASILCKSCKLSMKLGSIHRALLNSLDRDDKDFLRLVEGLIKARHA